MPDWSAAAATIAVVLGVTVYYTMNAWFAHRERMAKIEKGIDPGEQPFSGIKVQFKKGVNPPEPPN